MPTCPRCDGKKTSIAHVNTGPDAKKHRWEERQCDTCKGLGEITQEHEARIARGKEMRNTRVARGESLLDAAKRQGITPSQLSAIELGKVDV